MRRQNPPSAHIRKAEDLEKYLRPGMLACAYGVIALLWVAAIASVFAGLVLMSIMHPTPRTMAIAAVVCGVPVLFIFIAYLSDPSDPLSRYLSGTAKAWRCPLEVPADECVFKTGLRAGDEMLLVKLAFHYPARFQTLEIKERLYTFTHAALTSEFSMAYSLPSFSDVERVLDPSMEMLAAEYKIPVLYPEILDVRKMRVLYDIAELQVTSQKTPPEDEYLATGTEG